MQVNSHGIQIKKYDTPPMFNIFKEIIGITENLDRELETIKKNQVEKLITEKYNNQN